MQRKITQKLIEWKSKGNQRIPLLLNGARQVGKTYIIREFGREHYKNVIYVNLEINKLIASHFDGELNPERIITYLEASFDEAIIPEQTLIIFDEIQSCERALTSLKYFCEIAPEFHIIAAGSLLGVAINREKYSFPVGKVQTLTLYPLDFEEYLWAMGKQKLAGLITEHFAEDKALPDALHEQALELYRKYLIVGGMPGVVEFYSEGGKLIEVPTLQNDILNDYIADMSKYATHAESVRIKATYDSIPQQLAKDNKKFQYKIVQKGGNANLFGPSIDWLLYAGVVLKCQKIEQGLIPILVYRDLSSFKLYMGDVGLLTMRSALPQQIILSPLEEGNRFLGALTENYVACELMARGYNLCYWESNSIAEVDFVIQRDDLVVPVEVKAGIRTRSRSLSVFTEKYNPKYAMRISAKNFGFYNNIKSVPLYAVFCI